jgi:hypothetical protein
MPDKGARFTKNGVTGEWDGATWRKVDGAPTATPAAPASSGGHLEAGGAPAPARAIAVGTRHTKNGITGEWDGSTWRKVEEDPGPAKSDGSGAMAAGAGLAGLAAAVPVVRGLAGRLANLSTTVTTADPQLSLFGAPAAAARTVMAPAVQKAAAFAGRIAAPLNIAKQGYDVLTGKQSVWDAAKDAAWNEGGRRILRPDKLITKGAQLAQRMAAPVADALGAEGVAGMAAPLAVPLAGGLAGVAGSMGFLGALQHDANRKVTIDYSKKGNLDTAVARVFMDMRNSEANRGKTLDERMDDPNDVAMFRPDDTAEAEIDPAAAARAAILAKLGGVAGRGGL